MERKERSDGVLSRPWVQSVAGVIGGYLLATAGFVLGDRLTLAAAVVVAIALAVTCDRQLGLRVFAILLVVVTVGLAAMYAQWVDGLGVF